MLKPTVPCVWALALSSALATAADGPLNTALIPVPKLENDSYDWYARHEEVLRVGRAINPEIVLIGDSITHFWGGEPKSALANGPAEWQAAFGAHRTLNLGFGWDRIQNVLWRLDHGEFDGLQPAVVILHIGTNNLSDTPNARSNTAAEIVAGIREICRRVQAKAPRTQIILMAILPRVETADDPYRQRIQEINPLLVPLGQEPGIHLLDIGERLVQPDGRIAREVMPDFCHPAPKGYRVWAEALLATFAELKLLAPVP